jgi:hypothetical protein
VLGAGATDRLGGEVVARRPDIRFVDAPLSGSPRPGISTPPAADAGDDTEEEGQQ